MSIKTLNIILWMMTNFVWKYTHRINTHSLKWPSFGKLNFHSIHTINRLRSMRVDAVILMPFQNDTLYGFCLRFVENLFCEIRSNVKLTIAIEHTSRTESFLCAHWVKCEWTFNCNLCFDRFPIYTQNGNQFIHVHHQKNSLNRKSKV